MKKAAVISLCGLYLVCIAQAEDLQPPWWRGKYSTTSQVWEFNDPLAIQPDVFIEPDGPAAGGRPPLASTGLVWTPGLPPWDQWMEQDEGAFGVIPLSGWIDIIVDNHDPRPENEKWIWIQLTWRPQDIDEYPIFELIDPQPIASPRVIEEVIIGDPSHPLYWRETTFAFELDWNPPFEQIVIGGTINVDELVIDTWCVPEPATLALLGMGGLLLRRRRF